MGEHPTVSAGPRRRRKATLAYPHPCLGGGVGGGGPGGGGGMAGGSGGDGGGEGVLQG